MEGLCSVHSDLRIIHLLLVKQRNEIAHRIKMLEENLFSRQESTLASQTDFSFSVRFVVSLFFHSECALV